MSETFSPFNMLCWCETFKKIYLMDNFKQTNKQKHLVVKIWQILFFKLRWNWGANKIHRIFSLSLCPSVRLSIRPSVCVCPAIHPSIYLFHQMGNRTHVSTSHLLNLFLLHVMPVKKRSNIIISLTDLPWCSLPLPGFMSPRVLRLFVVLWF